MVWKVHNFECDDCEIIFDELYKVAEEHLVECPDCGGSRVRKLISAVNLASFSLASPEEQRAKLMKRSRDHTIKEMKKTPEKWGEEGKRRALKKDA